MTTTLPSGKVIEIKDEERTRMQNWTRVMGYFRIIEDFNIGKRQEARDRKLYRESAIPFMV